LARHGEQRLTDYESPCPKCEKKVEWNFAGNNGYVTMCGNCKRLFYYCAIFSTVDEFKPIHKQYDWNIQKMKMVVKNE